ncbi:hypothetical protein SLS60_009154 [Paraconiothyrium brasiliense]|uniref:Protein kinase domain-containing protein n=1 Tax=Paraconiothyrium brasiliense TaxID=300254 RepID=A0ABR3QWG6_9PLEO
MSLASAQARDSGPRLPRFSLNVTSFDGPVDGHAIEHSTQRNDIGHQDTGAYASDALGRLLRANTSIRPVEGNPTPIEFWPEDQLKELLTESCVKDAFKCPKLTGLAGSVNTIMRTHLKILAILSLMEKLKYIEKFMKNDISDEDLPLVECTTGDLVESHIARRTTPWQRLEFLKKLKIDQRRQFLRYQYCVSPPSLTMRPDGKSARHEEFPDQTIMPWTSALKKKEEGGYSQVFEVDVHPHCYDFREILESLSIPSGNKFAVKKLTKGKNQTAADIRVKFENEKRMLERFRGHPHLVTLLMSWTLKEEYYFLFPFAESDLDRYWSDATNWNALESSNPERHYETIRWISKQIYKMVEALEHIHNLDNGLTADNKRFGRHGDLKPENVLWYRSTKDVKGTFVIADLGLAACNTEHSRSGIPSNTVARTPNYRSPECDLEDGKISRSYDIWTFGCLLLEMVCWILGGPEARDDFSNERTSTYITGSQSDIFFDVEKKSDGTGHVMFLKRTVEKVRNART